MTDGPCRGKHDLERFRFCRSFDLHYPPKGPDGKRVCRWCGQGVGSRIYWCSDKCVREYQIASCKGGTIQYEVNKRDEGVCAACRFDTAKLRRILDKILHRSRYGYSRWRESYWNETEEQRQKRSGREGRLRARDLRLLEQLRDKYPWAFSRHYGDRLGQRVPLQQSLWEADHIVPVSEGGGACGLENFRTLCVPCHKAETKALAARRAKARKQKAE